MKTIPGLFPGSGAPSAAATDFPAPHTAGPPSAESFRESLHAAEHGSPRAPLLSGHPASSPEVRSAGRRRVEAEPSPEPLASAPVESPGANTASDLARKVTVFREAVAPAQVPPTPEPTVPTEAEAVWCGLGRTDPEVSEGDEEEEEPAEEGSAPSPAPVAPMEILLQLLPNPTVAVPLPPPPNEDGPQIDFGEVASPNNSVGPVREGILPVENPVASTKASMVKPPGEASVPETSSSVSPAGAEEAVAATTAELGAGESGPPPDSAKLHPGPRVARNRGQQADSSDGIGAAQQGASMNNLLEMEKVAGPAVHKLPGLEGAAEALSPQELSIRKGQLEERRASSQTSSIEQTGPQASIQAPVLTTSSATTESLTGLPVSPAERVAKAVMEGVAQLRVSGHDSVSVVLKPEAGPELHLRVEMRDGAVSAQLQFGQGDRSFLDRHLDELQQRLAQQGVRLERGLDLGSGQFAQSQQQQQQSRSPLPEAVLPKVSFSSVSPTTTRPQPAPGSRPRGFESWA